MTGHSIRLITLTLSASLCGPVVGQVPDIPKALRTPDFETFLSSAEGRNLLASAAASMEDEIARSRADPALRDYYKYLDAHEDFAAFLAIQGPAYAGHAQAQGELAWMYASGIGTSEDIDKAKRWYRKAANLGDLGSAGTLGSMLTNPQFGQPDYPEAIKLLDQCAIKLRPSCVVQLALTYAYPDNPERNIPAALVWSSIAVDGNFAGANRIGSAIGKMASVADVLAAKELKGKVVGRISETANDDD